MRPLCRCNLRPAAVNYKKNGKTYYRKQCDICISAKQIGFGIPNWVKSGYEKKSWCEKCGYKSSYDEQFNVFHIDGNLLNSKYTNLKTICANCQRILYKDNVEWKQGDLLPDILTN